MSTLEIVSNEVTNTISEENPEVVINEAVQEISIVNTDLIFTLEESISEIAFTNEDPELSITNDALTVDIVDSLTTINQYYSGGSAADGVTIEGTGQAGNPFKIADAVIDEQNSHLDETYPHLKKAPGPFVDAIAAGEAVHYIQEHLEGSVRVTDYIVKSATGEEHILFSSREVL